MSTPPDIAWIILTGGAPAWLITVKLGLLLMLALTTFVCQPLRPLHNFLIALIAFFGLTELRPRLNFTWPALQSRSATVFSTFACRPRRRVSWPSRWP